MNFLSWLYFEKIFNDGGDTFVICLVITMVFTAILVSAAAPVAVLYTWIGLVSLFWIPGLLALGYALYSEWKDEYARRSERRK